MTIRCIAIDDEPLALEVIKSHMDQIPDLELVASLNNPINAVEILNSNPIDLIFLDIEMPILSGIEFIKTLKSPPKVILTTAYRNYAIESYELDVVDYLLKPISFKRFFKAITKYKSLSAVRDPLIQNKTTEDSLDHLYVNSNKKHIKISFSEILYIESIKDYIRIILENSNVVTKETISNFETKLPKQFVRVHRSYIVNISKVTAFTKIDVEIGAIEIPIGAIYKNSVFDILK
ncbi:LytTR family DNA-binding domain-containing protein [Winogradskyella sp.]|uniref:LytR/AlgR family response regulator transcription factor n=1 Tax=Winogradskyella sp. TaxID=1883156 RepID=UPI00262FDF47|nr:LytTR family DNA-binding domain-containing protein [Winogradskyella sp.]